MTARPSGHPSARHPLMTAADPIPIASDPYPARRRRNADDLDPRRRRRHQHHTAGIVTLIGDDHTPGQDADEEAEGQCCDYPFALIHDRYHFALRTIKTLTSLVPRR